MKITLTVHHFPPNYLAGTEVYTFRLANWLLRRGHTVDVICIESITDAAPGEIRHTHEVYEDLSVYRLYFNLGQAADPFRHSYDNPAIGRWFADFLQRERPDLVHLHSGYLMSASIVAATKQQFLPLVVTLHDFWFVCPRITLLKPTGVVCRVPKNVAECAWCLAMDKRRFRWPELASRGAAGVLAQALLASPAGAGLLGIQPDAGEIARRRRVLIEALKQADLILSPSEFLRGIFVEQGIDPAKILYSRLGLDSGHWNVSSAADRMPSRHLRFSYIGQLVPHKGVHLLIAAFNRLSHSRRPARLIIYGNTSAFPRYAQRLYAMAKHNPAIELAGQFENREVANILRQTDVLVVPSIWYENSPVAILEALTTGTPVVGSNLGGIPELVQHDVNGLLYQAGSVADLARQLQRLSDEPGLVARLASQVRPARTIDDEMEGIVALYGNLSARRAVV
jgi:glycosyltransferase involved in cell wall biosynthesis